MRIIILLLFIVSQLFGQGFNGNSLGWTPMGFSVSTANFSLTDDFASSLNAAWTSGTWSVSGHKAVNTPTFGAELAADNTATSTVTEADATTGYGAAVSTLSSITDNRPGSSGTKAMNVLSTGTNGYATFGYITTTGNWCILNLWHKEESGSASQFYEQSNAVLFNPTTSATWTDLHYVYRAGASKNWRLYSPVNTYNVVYDDVSLRAFNVSSMFATVTTGVQSYTIHADTVTITKYTQAGVVVAFADSLNWIAAYHDGTNVTLLQDSAGTYRELIAPTAKTYAANATFSATRSGTNGATVAVTYNGSAVGSGVTILSSTILVATKCGMFSTYSGNSIGKIRITSP